MGAIVNQLEFYSSFISSGDTVFDIGANIGNKTSVFLQLGAKVVAVEPHPAHIARLHDRFPEVIVVPKAVGRAVGRAIMEFGGELNLTSLSPEWIKAVSGANRFPGHKWNHQTEIELTTLDNLVREYSKPAFVKIDVEGYESEVLRGLSQPLGTLSFEFTPEHTADTEKCINILESLGRVEFNYSVEESLQMGLERWLPGDELLAALSRFSGSSIVYGDVYARFLS